MLLLLQTSPKSWKRRQNVTQRQEQHAATDGTDTAPLSALAVEAARAPTPSRGLRAAAVAVVAAQRGGSRPGSVMSNTRSLLSGAAAGSVLAPPVAVDPLSQLDLEAEAERLMVQRHAIALVCAWVCALFSLFRPVIFVFHCLDNLFLT